MKFVGVTRAEHNHKHKEDTPGKQDKYQVGNQDIYDHYNNMTLNKTNDK
jgi:hypothetical protein